MPHFSYNPKLSIFLCSLLIPATLISMNYDSSGRGDGRGHNRQSILEQYALHFPESSQGMFTTFQNAPQEAQAIVRHLQDPNYFNTPDYRYAMFFGSTELNKMMAACAIGCQLASRGWRTIFFENEDITSDQPAEAAKKLTSLFNEIAGSDDSVLMVMNGFDKLFENNRSAETILRGWFDRLEGEGNSRHFFIGIVDRLHILPQSIKHRILLNCIKFGAN